MLLGTYAVLGLWLLSRPMLGELQRLAGWIVPLPPWSSDPFWLAFAPYWSPATVTGGDYAWFLTVTVAISALLATLATAGYDRFALAIQVPRVHLASTFFD